MTEEDGEKRRATPRVNCRWNVKCVTEQKKAFNTKAINISQGGVQVIAPVAFKKGDRLYMEITGYLAGANHVIKVVGVVVYVSLSSSDDMQLGLKFVSNLAIQDSKFLQAFVKSMVS